VPEDDTIRVRPVPRQGRTLLMLGVAGIVGASAGGAWLFLREAPPAAPSLAPPSLPAPRPAIPVLSEAEVLAEPVPQARMLRLRENPRVFILLFPDLAGQGRALNRIAALVEKAGLPRDRLLRDGELADAIAASGDTPETWYLGHDYRADDLARFFILAARDGVALTEEERWVEARLAEAMAAAGPGIPVALISVGGAGPKLDPVMRAAVLRHEIGHGHYFTLPSFAAHVQRIWRDAFTEAERGAFRSFLRREGYDSSNEDLMANEAMAYLLFTPDPRFFNAAMVEMAEAAVERLRGLLREGLPGP